MAFGMCFAVCGRDGWVTDMDTEDCVLAFSAAGLSGADTYPSCALDGRPLHVQWIIPGHYTFEAISTVEPLFSTELRKILNVRLSFVVATNLRPEDCIGKK